jgi:hypothetical protein
MTKYIIPILFLFVAITGCNKDNFVDTDAQVGSSKVTYFAIVTMNGDEYMSLVKGSTFTDPGATATEKGQSVTVTASGKVDVNKPGLYTITYSAINKDGFAATATRTVVVLDAHENTGVDVSGSYDYAGSGSYTATITKVAEGVYTTDNCYSAATTIPIVFVTLDGTNITIPEQMTGFGPLFGTGTIASTGALTYLVNLPKYGIADSERKWKKK